MARLQLNKTSLSREAAQLEVYQRFLPALDLKRQQLMAERAKERESVSEMKREIAEFATRVGRDLPMLANDTIDLDGLVRLTDYHMIEENVTGVRLPRLDRIEVAISPYSNMAKPHWVDEVAQVLRDMLEARLRLHVAMLRLDQLETAVTAITQRVNLFDKVLIPTARANIKKIRVHLSDEQMATVVRSKMSKNKRTAA